MTQFFLELLNGRVAWDRFAVDILEGIGTPLLVLPFQELGQIGLLREGLVRFSQEVRRVVLHVADLHALGHAVLGHVLAVIL